MPDSAIKSRIESGEIDPKEVSQIERSVKGKEVAPTIAEQTGSFVDWKNVRDTLGQPHDVDRIPLKKLRQIRRDAMVAFALHYRKTPLVRAQWHMEARDKDGANAQIAGFYDSAWRAVHARYIFQHTLDFDWGFQSIVKRFVESNPGGVWLDVEETDQTKQLKPVWDEGTVLPIIWKPFVALPPDRVVARFNDSTGEFDGITYTPPQNQAGGRSKGGRSKKGNTTDREFDVYHSLWVTNQKDNEFGNLYGFPLIGHAYRFWWSYWFLWANLDRAFERMAVPPLVAYHPEGDYVDEDTGEKVPYWQIAIEAAERLRSNSVAAVPGTIATAGLEERGTQQREWEFKFLETPSNNFTAIQGHLSYLDVMKLRACWVPEQAFIEGEGGSSSRNVAAQMAEIFLESQANKWEEIADHINRYILPQLVAVNHPEFVNNGGTVRIIGHGFAQEDVDFLKQIIQLIGQGNPQDLQVDVRTALERVGVPLKTPTQLNTEKEQLIQQQVAMQPPPLTPSNGQVGVVPAGGFTNGGSQPEPGSAGSNGAGTPGAPNPVAAGNSVTGFDEGQMVYVNPRPHIELADHDEFLAALPQTGHYQDVTIRALAVQMRKLWLGALRNMYASFAKSLTDDTLRLSDEEASPIFVEFAEDKKSRNLALAQKAADKALKQWQISDEELERLAQRSRNLADRLMKRSINVVAKQKGLAPTVNADSYDDFLERQIARLVKSVTKTTKENLRTLLVNDIMEGLTSNQIAQHIREHFDSFPEWRADMIARSETRDAYNEATLQVGENTGMRYVVAKDAQKGPTDEMCEERDGKLYTIREARKQKTHPRDTLEWNLVPRANFSIENVNELPEQAPEGCDAWFDAESCTAYVPVNMSDEDANEFLSAVVEVL